MQSLKTTLKSVLRPLRVLAGRFVIRDRFEPTIFYKAADITSAEHVKGDYLEFGVYKGSSFVDAYNIIKLVYEGRFTDRGNRHSPEYRAIVKELWQRMRFFAFDSFQGLPPVAGIDTYSSDFVQGKFRSSLDDFLQNLRSHSVEMDKVIAIPGWFEDTCKAETIKQYSMNSASIVNIDCDLYDSTKVVLKFIEPLLVDGTVLIFDDWYFFHGNPNLGEQRAFREWSRSMDGWIFTEYQKEGSSRNSFIANRAMSPQPHQDRTDNVQNSLMTDVT